MGKNWKEFTKTISYVIVQDLWKIHYQILLKEFIKLNVNTTKMIKKYEI